MGVLIESKRDDRTLAWLIVEFGEEPLTAPCQGLAGNGWAYVSTFAKALEAPPPATLAATPDQEALDHIRQILDLLGVAS